MPHSYIDLITDQIHQAGWSYGYLKLFVPGLGYFWQVDAYRDGLDRYIVMAFDSLHGADV